jgi:hypothetical protein
MTLPSSFLIAEKVSFRSLIDLTSFSESTSVFLFGGVLLTIELFFCASNLGLVFGVKSSVNI